MDGKYNSGKVTFKPLGPNQTRINVELTYDTEGMKEALGSALGFDSRRVSGDLDRFKEFVENQQTETGAWRGEVHQGTVRAARQLNWAAGGIVGLSPALTAAKDSVRSLNAAYG